MIYLESYKLFENNSKIELGKFLLSEVEYFFNSLNDDFTINFKRFNKDTTGEEAKWDSIFASIRTENKEISDYTVLEIEETINRCLNMLNLTITYISIGFNENIEYNGNFYKRMATKYFNIKDNNIGDFLKFISSTEDIIHINLHFHF